MEMSGYFVYDKMMDLLSPEVIVFFWGDHYESFI